VEICQNVGPNELCILNKKKVETYCKQMQNFWCNMPLGYYGPTHNSKTLEDGKVVGTSGV
jgi:hypothetical protein